MYVVVLGSFSFQDANGYAAIVKSIQRQAEARTSLGAKNVPSDFS